MRRLTVVPGLLGAYPNAIRRVNERDLPAFEAAIRSLASRSDYRALSDRFAIRRTSSGFWAASDALHKAWRSATPLEAGLPDANRLENRRRHACCARGVRHGDGCRAERTDVAETTCAAPPRIRGGGFARAALSWSPIG